MPLLTPNLMPAETPGCPIDVLVVEDHEDDFRYLSFLLGRNGTDQYHLHWASSYDAGLKALRDGGHDVALFDYRLGGGTGIDLLREARAFGVEMPIILLTGHDSIEVDREASQAGASDYLCKNGLNGTDLERAIRYAIRQAEMTAALRRSQQQLESFMHSVPCAVCIRDEDGRLLFSNELFSRNFGLDTLELPGGSTCDARAWPLAHNGRHWLVNSFAMTAPHGRNLCGFAAIDVTARIEAEAERDREAQLLAVIMRNLPVIAGRIDEDGRVIEARGTGLERLGWTPDTLIGKDFAGEFPQSPAAIADAARGVSSNFTLVGHTNDQEWQLEFFLMADPDRKGGVTFFGRDITERRWLEQRLLTISDAEQQRIGADLHDGLGQQLTGMACLAAALRDRLKKVGPAEAENADLIARLASDSVAQTRALARGLCPVQLEKSSLPSALDDLTYQAQLLHGIDCRHRIEGPPPEIEHLTAIHLYRITQEAIHNATRHGGAKRIRVTLSTQGRQYRLTVTDDGCGFDPSAVRRGAGSGLRLMGYRANMIGGTFLAESQPGRGTQITVSFTSPSHPNENQHYSRSPDGAFDGGRSSAETPHLSRR